MKVHVSEGTRAQIVSSIEHWAARSELPTKQLADWVGLPYGKFLRWRKRLREPRSAAAKVIPKSHWLLPREVEAIVGYCRQNPGHGYRRLTWMLTDDDVAYASPSSVYRILKARGLLLLQEGRSSRKGKGFEQPCAAHEHWHVDFSYFKVGAVFYYFIGILDGYSRAILAWDLREKMEERDAEIVLQEAKERFPEATPRIISDCGGQFRSDDFKRFVTEIEASHVMTSPYHPQSNGKLERFHLTLKEYAYKRVPLDLADARRIIDNMIDYYNAERLHSSIGYVTPQQCLDGQREAIVERRRTKHREAAQMRKAYWAQKDLDESPADDLLQSPGEAEAARAEERAAKEYPGQATDEAQTPSGAQPGARAPGTTAPMPLREPAMPPKLPLPPQAAKTETEHARVT